MRDLFAESRDKKLARIIKQRAAERLQDKNKTKKAKK